MRETRKTVRMYTTIVPALVVGAFFALAGGTVAAVKATEAPSFCAKCHEMTPYHDAWQKGPHKDVACVACHVDPGTTAKVTHKVSALKEVWDHFATSPKFPGDGVSVPDARCLACHTDLPARTKSGFPHAQHVKDGSCTSCHGDAGHKVSPDSLKKAGLLAPGVLTSAVSKDTTSGVHVKVDCSRCHDLAKVACDTCHTSPHKPRGKCDVCHAPGPSWKFAHPDTSAACTTCHEQPKNHFAGACTSCHDLKTPFAKTVYKHTSAECTTCHTTTQGHVANGSQCSTCHPKTGVSWDFAHPASAACTSCHAAPANHFGSSCANCHKPSIPFAATKYTHGSTACADCHSRPSGHFKGACASCHKPGVPFAATKWSHPTSTACQSCHSRPSGHNGNACSTCHKRPGKSWAFSHPGSSACTNCHRAPASHFGTDCASCHSPGRAWSSARFSHPSIGAPHGISGKSCVSCHPAGPPAVSCTCHGGGSGPKGD